jgi:UPF0716 protein FxsA
MMKFWAALWPIIALAVPVLEMVGIYRIWLGIGAWTLVWLLLAALLGAALIAAERATFLPSLAQTMLGGKPPLGLIFASGQRFLAGVLLILPGAISDVAAILLLFRAGLATTPARGKRGARASAPPDVIEGEFERVEDAPRGLPRR